MDKFGCSFETKNHRRNEQIFRSLSQFPKTTDGNYDMQNMKLCNVAEPTLSQDSSTKNYVDSVNVQVQNNFEDRYKKLNSLILDLKHEISVMEVSNGALKSDVTKRIMRLGETLSRAEERLRNEMNDYGKDFRSRINSLKIPKMNEIVKEMGSTSEDVERRMQELLDKKTGDLSTRMEVEIRESTQNLEKQLSELREKEIARICEEKSSELEAKITTGIQNLEKQLNIGADANSKITDSLQSLSTQVNEIREKEIAKICSKKIKKLESKMSNDVSQTYQEIKKLETKMSSDVNQTYQEVNKKLKELDEIVQNIISLLNSRK